MITARSRKFLQRLILSAIILSVCQYFNIFLIVWRRVSDWWVRQGEMVVSCGNLIYEQDSDSDDDRPLAKVLTKVC